jgi:ATP-dependent Clp protease ATP-binding subunit ClpC
MGSPFHFDLTIVSDLSLIKQLHDSPIDMELNIPIFVRRSTEAGGLTRHSCEPLFKYEDGFRAEGVDLGKVIRRLTDSIRRWAAAKLNEANQSVVAEWDVAEPIETVAVKLHLMLSDRTLKLKLMLVVLEREPCRIVFSPSLPHVYFDVKPEESIEDRAVDVYTSHFNQCLKDRNEHDIEMATSNDDMWIDTIRISVDSNTVPKKPIDPILAFLGGPSTNDGASELMQVGRCLDWADIDSLANPIGLDEPIQRILERFSLADRRGLVLIGPSGSGKTAAIEGAVRRRRLAETGKERKNGLVWQLTPARLISGMSYLGQWQSRLIAIWKHASRHDLVLYIEDMLGLFEAGVTRDSRACAADLIRSQIEVAPVRIVTEMTPEAWAIFRERDRAFAQQFIVLPMEGKSRDDALPIMLGMVAHLESKHRCRFHHDVLPEVLGLYDRFERTSVLPGKAIAAVQRLAKTHERKPVDREAAQKEFMGRTGLSKLVIDSEARLTRQQITAALGEHVVGQTVAIERITDRILAAAARVNDTSRPLGVFLLLGPTGVGKTELAKTVARFLFGEEGLIRIDMNELATMDAAARLVGTFSSPDGILTMAARRRPHAVLLLDEIEKADPSVLDTLLQVIGEARLTDARGRTVDLSGMMILMTSNLGASHSNRSTVLNDANHLRSEVYRRAAKDFFRPEFFNRIDGLLEFEPLDLDVVAQVAQRQIDEVLRRDGLGRRLMVVDIEPGVLRDVVRRGFDPRLGARAVKRQIEREVVGPIANVLVASQSDELMVIHATSGESGLNLSVKSIALMTPDPASNEVEPPAEWLLTEAERLLNQIEAETPKRPISVSTSGHGIEPELLRYMTLQEQIQACREAMRHLEDVQDETSSRRPVAIPPAPVKTKQMIRHWVSMRGFLLDIQASHDIQQYLREGTETKSVSRLQAASFELQRSAQRLVSLFQGMKNPCHRRLTSRELRRLCAEQYRAP